MKAVLAAMARVRPMDTANFVPAATEAEVFQSQRALLAGFAEAQEEGMFQIRQQRALPGALPKVLLNHPGPNPILLQAINPPAPKGSLA